MGRTLLLADDSVTIQKVVGISFANEDVQLVTVDNGDDAVTKAREMRPDVILADVVMPGKSGYEVCEAIQADPELRHIPVLLLTGTFEAFDDDRARECGAAGHVSKPFEAQTLVARVLEHFERPPAPVPAAVVAADTPVPIARITPRPEAADAPVAEPIDPASESFDFFDEDLGDLSPVGDTPRREDPLDVEPAPGGFAFGDDLDLEREAGTGQDGPADHTVAMLPDELEVEPADAVADFDLAPPPPAVAAASASETRIADDDSFDFAIGDPIEAEPAPISPETVLDPKGASGFDVSSSDLSESPPVPFPDAAAPPAPEAPAPLETVAELEADPLGFELPPAVDPERPEPPETRLPEPLAEPLPAALEEPAEDPIFAIAPEPEPAAAQVVDESSLEDLVPLEATPEPEPRITATHDAAALAGVALAEIEPKLREKIHDTLEKVAWESFGDVAEQIVRQAIERVEQVAWEVVPQLAETLIREEIRRMKGESE